MVKNYVLQQRKEFDASALYSGNIDEGHRELQTCTPQSGMDGTPSNFTTIVLMQLVGRLPITSAELYGLEDSIMIAYNQLSSCDDGVTREVTKVEAYPNYFGNFDAIDVGFKGTTVNGTNYTSYTNTTNSTRRGLYVKDTMLIQPNPRELFERNRRVYNQEKRKLHHEHTGDFDGDTTVTRPLSVLAKLTFDTNGYVGKSALFDDDVTASTTTTVLEQKKAKMRGSVNHQIESGGGRALQNVCQCAAPSTATFAKSLNETVQEAECDR